MQTVIKAIKIKKKNCKQFQEYLLIFGWIHLWNVREKKINSLKLVRNKNARVIFMHVYKVYSSKQSMTVLRILTYLINLPTRFFFFFQHFNVRLYQITFIFSIFHAFSWRTITITNTETPPRARISELPSYRSCRRFVVDRLVTADPGRGWIGRRSYIIISSIITIIIIIMIANYR